MSNEKNCYRCNKIKKIEEFAHDGKNIKGVCHICYITYYGDPVNNRKEKLKRENEKNKLRQVKNMDKCRRYVAALLHKSKCVDCGINNPIVLDFDHKDPSEKIQTVSLLIRAGRYGAMLKEIAKCEIVCSNCHRLRTAKQFDFWRLRIEDYIK